MLDFRLLYIVANKLLTIYTQPHPRVRCSSRSILNEHESSVEKFGITHTMSSENNAKQPENDHAPPESALTMKSPEPGINEPPYSIFDKKQKWLIIIIVSTAATCKLFWPRIV